jgi:hypothetical protein
MPLLSAFEKQLAKRKQVELHDAYLSIHPSIHSPVCMKHGSHWKGFFDILCCKF